MSIRATSPFPVYLDIDGNPLSQGYVYFGTSGANPETTPQAVYWDEALTIPAAQPLRTLNGFLVRNGTPASVYLSAVYSITVRNKNRVLLYSSLVNPGAPVSTAMVPVVSAATLAAARDALGVSKKVKGYQAISLTHFTDTLEPSIAAGSEIEVDGTFYEFPIDEAAVAGGWAAIAISTIVYMYLVPAGAAHTWIYSATAPTWDIAKQGWYNGANRAFGGLYKDAGGNYTSKWLHGVGQGGRENLPIGSILMFDGTGWVDNATLPGWYACIAANAGVGCPDLVDRFIMGKVVAGAGATGGSNTHTISSAELPTHAHTIAHAHWAIGDVSTIVYGVGGGGTYAAPGAGTTLALGKTGNPDTANSGNGGFANTAINTKPAYYSVIFIRKCL